MAPGVPLRLYLTKRLTKRMDEPVHAKLIEPLFAFDREVVPAGAEVVGRVTRLDPVPRRARAAALLGGDFTPLHRAEVQFTEIVMPGGRRIALNTLETEGLTSIFTLSSAKKKPSKSGTPNHGGILGIGRQQAQAQISGRTRGVIDMVRGPDKVERLEDLLLAKLPYHPQWIRKGTRFDAELRDPVRFGDASFKEEDLRLVGTQPPADTVVHARLITPLNSKTSKLGSKVDAVISQPLFSADHKLILPEGTHVTGSVTLTQRARWFHRGGQLRFNFENIDLAPGLGINAVARPTIRTAATLIRAESTGRARVQVDQEGSAKTVEPKARLLNTALAVLLAANSTEREGDQEVGATGNTDNGRASMGGLSGLGVVGSVAGRLSRNTGIALAFYGMAGSIFTNVLARGVELEFANNSAIDIRFGARR